MGSCRSASPRYAVEFPGKGKQSVTTVAALRDRLQSIMTCRWQGDKIDPVHRYLLGPSAVSLVHLIQAVSRERSRSVGA